MPGNADGSTDDIVVDIEGLTDEQKEAVLSFAKKTVAERLKPIKLNLDKAFGERDTAAKELKKVQDAAASKEAERLQAEGRELEAAQLRLSQAEEARRAAEEAALIANQRLTLVERDGMVTAELASFEFRDAKALGMARKSVIELLSKDTEGVWKNAEGKSIKETVANFCEEHEFLLKPKVSSGSGNGSPSGRKSISDKSASGMSQAEVLANVQSGQLRRQRNR